MKFLTETVTSFTNPKHFLKGFSAELMSPKMIKEEFGSADFTGNEKHTTKSPCIFPYHVFDMNIYC